MKGAGLPILTASILLVYANIAMPIGNFAAVGASQLFKTARAVMAGYTLMAAASAAAFIHPAQTLYRF